MFNLKPSREDPEYWSERRTILKIKKGYWTVKEYYSPSHYLSFEYWKYDGEDYLIDNEVIAYLKKIIHVPLNLNAFYIQFIYIHLGKCHKNYRSKFYIGKARENKLK